MSEAKETILSIPCPSCGGEGGEKIIVAGMEMKACCDACEESKADDWKQEEERRRNLKRMLAWESVCDSQFRKFNPNHPEMFDGFGEACESFDPKCRQGLGMIGNPGSGKTHVALWCLKKCIDEGLTVARVKHSHFAKMAVTLSKGYGSTNEESKDYYEADQQIKQLYAAGAIVIDDICKGRKTPTSDELFFDLLDSRVDNSKITIWTANGGSDWMRGHFGEEYGEPIVRRLAQRTIIKSTKQINEK